MKASITRRIDQLGRVVIPMSMRKANNLGIRDPVDISVENDAIVIRKSGPGCVFCGKRDGDLLTFHGRAICKSCRQEITEKKD